MELDLNTIIKDRFIIDIKNTEQKLTGTYTQLTDANIKDLEEPFKDSLSLEKKVNANYMTINRISSDLQLLQVENNLRQTIAEDDKTVKFIPKEALARINKIQRITAELTAVQLKNEPFVKELKTKDLKNLYGKAQLKMTVVFDEGKDLLVTKCIDVLGVNEVLETIIKAVAEGKQKDIES